MNGRDIPNEIKPALEIMNARLMAEQWKGMTASERIERCSALADQAMKHAETASLGLAEGYLQIAAQWLRLGEEIARERSAYDGENIA